VAWQFWVSGMLDKVAWVLQLYYNVERKYLYVVVESLVFLNMVKW